MTIVCRFGGDLFILIEDLCRVESRAVLSMIPSIMTIEAKHLKHTLNNQFKQHKDRDKNLEDIKQNINQ